MRILKALATAVAGTAIGLSGAAASESYPERAIRLIVPFGAGSPTDIVGRQAAASIGEGLGQQVVVENRPGAGGTIGTTEVARAAPDGYTLLIITNSTHAANLALFRTLPYDPVADFTPISNLNASSLLLLAHPSVPATDVAELLEYGRANPRALRIGESGASTIIASAQLRDLGGFEAIRVPYDSIPPALTDMLSGQISLTFTDIGSGLPHVESGSAVALGVTSAERSPLAPDVPTLAEAGLTGYRVAGWQGIAAPSGTDPAIIDKIYTALADHYDTEDVRARFAAIGLEGVVSESPQEFSSFLEGEAVRWVEMVQSAGIEPQ